MNLTQRHKAPAVVEILLIASKFRSDYEVYAANFYKICGATFFRSYLVSLLMKPLLLRTFLAASHSGFSPSSVITELMTKNT